MTCDQQEALTAMIVVVLRVLKHCHYVYLKLQALPSGGNEPWHWPVPTILLETILWGSRDKCGDVYQIILGNMVEAKVHNHGWLMAMYNFWLFCTIAISYHDTFFDVAILQNFWQCHAIICVMLSYDNLNCMQWHYSWLFLPKMHSIITLLVWSNFPFEIGKSVIVE